MSYYASKKSKLLKDFDTTATCIQDHLIQRYGQQSADTLRREARQEYEKLIPEVPYIKGVRARALNSFLLENFTAGKNAVLLIDESQNLPLTTLEQIRMLSNLETEKEKLLQIVLIGQPELDDLLHAPLLKQLNERITVRYDIEPLDRDQILNYVEHRLTVAGRINDIPRFLSGAYNAIYDFSNGIPRRINTIADRALLIAYTKDNREIDTGIIEQAAHDIGGRHMISHKVRFTSPWWNIALYVLFFVIILALLGIINSENIENIVSSWKSAP